MLGFEGVYVSGANTLDKRLLIQRFYRLHISGGQVCKHLRYGPSCHRMRPFWRNIGQRHQHKGAILHPGVRQNQPVRRSQHLRLWGNRPPPGLFGGIGIDRITQGQQIKIQRPHPPPGGPLASEGRLDQMQIAQK